MLLLSLTTSTKSPYVFWVSLESFVIKASTMSPIGTLPRPNLIGPLIPIGEHTGHAGPPDGGKSLLPHEHSFINCEPIFRGNLLHLEIGILTPVGMFMIWICLILFCDGDYGIQKWIVMMVMMMMMMMMMMIVNRKDSRIS